MPTILTPEQFRERYGIDTQPQVAEKQPTSGIQNAASRAGERFTSTFQQTGRGEINPISGSIQTIGAGAGFLTDIIFEGLKAITPKPIKEAVKGGIQRVASQPKVADIIGNVSQWAKQHPEAAANLSSLLDIAAITPAGKGLQVAGRVAARGARTAARGAGKGLALTGAATEKTGKKVVSTLFTPTIDQAKRVISFQAKSTMLERLGWSAKNIEKAPITLADTIIKYDLSGFARGNIGARSKRIANDLFTNQVNPALSAIEGRVSKKSIFDAVRKDINKVKDISRRKGLLDAFDALADDYKNVLGWTYKTLDGIKSEMSRRLPSKIWRGQEIAGDLNNVRVSFAAQARKTIREKLPKAIRDIYDDYGSLKEIAERGAKALTRGFDAGILGITSEAIRIMVTPITTIGGRAIKEVGTIIKKAGQALQR